jgi:uncharacterized protein YPO0396
MNAEQLLKLQKLIYECMQGEKDSIWEAREIQWESQSDDVEHQRGASIMRRWLQMRIDAAEERLAWLRTEFDAVTLGKVE